MVSGEGDSTGSGDKTGPTQPMDPPTQPKSKVGAFTARYLAPRASVALDSSIPSTDDAPGKSAANTQSQDSANTNGDSTMPPQLPRPASPDWRDDPGGLHTMLGPTAKNDNKQPLKPIPSPPQPKSPPEEGRKAVPSWHMESDHDDGSDDSFASDDDEGRRPGPQNNRGATKFTEQILGFAFSGDEPKRVKGIEGHKQRINRESKSEPFATISLPEEREDRQFETAMRDLVALRPPQLSDMSAKTEEALQRILDDGLGGDVEAKTSFQEGLVMGAAAMTKGTELSPQQAVAARKDEKGNDKIRPVDRVAQVTRMAAVTSFWSRQLTRQGDTTSALAYADKLIPRVRNQTWAKRLYEEKVDVATSVLKVTAEEYEEKINNFRNRLQNVLVAEFQLFESVTSQQNRYRLSKKRRLGLRKRAFSVSSILYCIFVCVISGWSHSSQHELFVYAEGDATSIWEPNRQQFYALYFLTPLALYFLIATGISYDSRLRVFGGLVLAAGVNILKLTILILTSTGFTGWRSLPQVADDDSNINGSSTRTFISFCIYVLDIIWGSTIVSLAVRVVTVWRTGVHEQIPEALQLEFEDNAQKASQVLRQLLLEDSDEEEVMVAPPLDFDDFEDDSSCGGAPNASGSEAPSATMRQEG